MFNSKFSSKILSAIINKMVSKKIKKDFKLNIEGLDVVINDDLLHFEIQGTMPKENLGDVVDIFLKK